MTATGSSRSATSASCGPENAVFMNIAFAPSLLTATYASTQPRWLRHMIATPSPALTPARERVRECVGALVLLAERQRAALVDQPDLVRVSGRRGLVPGGGRRAPADQ